MRLLELFERSGGTAAVAFGRMNPPTIGHQKVVDAILKQKADAHFLFVSQTHKPTGKNKTRLENPLPFDIKLGFIQQAFPNIDIGDTSVGTAIGILQNLEKQGFKNVIFVCGSDRVSAFTELFNKQNGVDYDLKSIKIVSSGARDPDADGADGMSASKMRAAAIADDFESFKTGLPSGLSSDAEEVFSAVRQGLEPWLEQGVTEGPTDDPGFQKMMGKIQKSTPTPMSGYVALSFASEGRSKKIKGVKHNGKPMPDVIDDPEEFLGGKIEFTPDQIEQELMSIGEKYGWDSIDPGQGQGYTEMFFDTSREYTSNNQSRLAANIVRTVNEINKFFNNINRSLQSTGLPGYTTDVWQGMGPSDNINQIEDLTQITSIAKKQDVEESSLNEFDPGEDGFGPFKVYVHDEFIEKFATFDQAKEEIEFLRTADPKSFDADWKIIDGTGKTVWQHDPGEAIDAMRMRRKLQFIKPDEGVEEASLGSVLQWPEVVNKVSSAMKATGWKGKRMSDDAFMFTTRGAEVEDQWYIAIIDNAGDGFFTYALGTVEEGDPHIDDAFKGRLPNTEASVSELMNEIRDGFGLD